jgi:hypothetical protein
METFKQIVYRDSDTALMIIPTNDELQVVPHFVNELTESQQATFEQLKEFCLTKTNSLAYGVYFTDERRFDIQPIEGDVILVYIDELDPQDKLIFDEVGVICTDLLNA